MSSFSENGNGSSKFYINRRFVQNQIENVLEIGMENSRSLCAFVHVSPVAVRIVGRVINPEFAFDTTFLLHPQ